MSKNDQWNCKRDFSEHVLYGVQCFDGLTVLYTPLCSGVLQQREAVAPGDRPLRQRERQQAAGGQQV